MKLYDINKLPKSSGILVFYVSMSRIGNGQSAKECFKSAKHFLKNKIKLPKVAINIIYSDTLYAYSNNEASLMKNKYFSLMHSHKFNFDRIIKQNISFIEEAFTFTTWNQLLLESKIFLGSFGKIRKLYNNDKRFQKYVLKDLKKFNLKLNENNLKFILEEILVFYLVAKKQIKLRNKFLYDNYNWCLNCYPGTPLYSEIYLFQLNPLKLNCKGNLYQNAFYDLGKKKIYHLDKINLEELT